MKTSTCKYILLCGAAGFIIACSTKKDNFINRNYHAVTTEYNVLYNGELALQAGINDLKTTYADNYWDILPVEKMQPNKEEMEPTDKRNANFERAETKATKAIQKHSMNLGGTERNPQMDEAHLLLGKARYYDNRFIPALEAFNYVLYKHKGSSRIDEVKVWREKTNIRLENEGTAIKNLNQLLKEKEGQMDEQIYSDANAMLAQAYINSTMNDSAVFVLKRAVAFTKDREKEARYRFILGQLYGKMKQSDSAYAYYQSVIEMNRKSPRRYVIQAHAMQAGLFDYENGDTLAFMKNMRDLLEDRENRPYLDIIHHQVALYFDKQGNKPKAIKHYNKSLRTKSTDKYLMASNYRNIGEIHFNNAKYPMAGKYYDSTLVYLDVRGREFKAIKKKRDNLEDVIKYETIAQNNDSILHIVSLSEAGRVAFFEDYIKRLKEQEERERKRLEAEAQRQANIAAASANISGDDAMGSAGGMQTSNSRRSAGTDFSANVAGKGETVAKGNTGTNPGSGAPAGMPGSTTGGGSKFYFYTPSTVSYGKLEFKKRWGERPLADNWRWASELRNRTKSTEETAVANTDSLSGGSKDENKIDERYTTDFYIKQLPTRQGTLDTLATDRNFAYYQLGLIYKEKFKEYKRAADKLEKLLVSNPEERLVLPAKYNLYKIYQIIDPAKAENYKQQVLAEYPDSRYAEIIKNPTLESVNNESPEAVYAAVYKQYEEGKPREVYAQLEKHIETYTAEEIVSKFELLKARVTGRLKGLEEYKRSLNYVALTYPNRTEGKLAEGLLKTDIPSLEKNAFGKASASWKIIFKFDNPADPKIEALKSKIEKFIKEGLNNRITITQDVYTMTEDFLVVHGFNSKLAAEEAASVLKEYKEYKIAETPIVISSEDYKVVQIKKNIAGFLAIK
ncbi:gliding motility protein [Flavobacterium sp. MFBS3-15]|uniref:type IX secretion system periplasmic lipoprotein PorW/SprE n=1 Tax=Flavobacterium sp. MFBS3-15 TaxID=2989816 RepID=UPI0022355A1C|nr:tetratricopeptide repeat protein [Flavobacterium sp. MFBS3-15]MCW4469198.1 gliding motility protein [Flavobacterium sp. MFBS3-15]